MKKGVIALILVVLMVCSFASADIIFSQQIGSVYNLGDTIPIPVAVKTSNVVIGNFEMNLICNGTSVNFYRNGVSLNAGEEKNFDSSLVLVKQIIGQNKGDCEIKATLGNDYATSNQFIVSDLLNIQGSQDKTNAKPGESVIIKGTITREDGANSNGFVEADIMSDGEIQATSSGTINKGDFSINVSVPSGLSAGNYIIELKAFEKDSEGIVTNNGVAYYNLSVPQVPTNLELIVTNDSINPGDTLIIKPILHDQTGKAINAVSTITIKDSNNKVVEQSEVQAGQSLEYHVKSTQPPAEWRISAVSEGMSTQDTFSINAKEDVSIEIVNQTIIVTNTGNVPYNKTLLVKVGENSLNIQVKLNVGENKKYVLTAPDGSYQVEVTGDDGNKAASTLSLTGGAIDIREISNGYFGIGIWIFLILVLGGTIAIILRKLYKKPFVGRNISKIDKTKGAKQMQVIKDNIVTRAINKAELSLSIKGERQEASVICLKIKNLNELKSRKASSIAESVQKATDLAQENKAVTYENQDYLFFIFAPIKTRTFKNERTALDVAEKIQAIMIEHNKMFSQKIDFGISLNQGIIVAKVENGVMKFMSMDSLITMAKKIAHLSKEEVLLSEKINDLLRLQIRTEKNLREGVSVYVIKEIKRENEEAKKFIERFMNRQGK